MPPRCVLAKRRPLADRTNWRRRAKTKELKNGRTRCPAPVPGSRVLAHTIDNSTDDTSCSRTPARFPHWPTRGERLLAVVSLRARGHARDCALVSEIARTCDRLAPVRTRCGVTAQMSRLPVRWTGNGLSSSAQIACGRQKLTVG